MNIESKIDKEDGKLPDALSGLFGHPLIPFLLGMIAAFVIVLFELRYGRT